LPVAALLVDHHAPEGSPGPSSTVVSGYGEQPQTTTAALLRRLVPEAPAWLAAVGAVGDLGDDGFALPECAGAPRTAVRTLVPLVNAPRRVQDGPVGTALALLVESPDAKAALRDPRVVELEEARATWRAAYDAAVRTPPRFHGEVAVVRISSSAQIHPLLAATWRRRLHPRVVIAANDGYVPGRVNFAARGGAGTDLRDVLRTALPEATGELGNGHDTATGGSLPPEEFELLLRRLEGRS
jgi:single-stranded DNA-specific DHH superfamily exonuclease